MTTAVQREVLQLVRNCGLDIIDQYRNGGGHLSMMLEAPNGARKRFTFSLSPSDWRARKNDEADLRRFVAANPALQPSTVMAEALAKAATKPPSTPPAPPVQEIAPMPTPQPKKPMRNMLSTAMMFKLCKWFAELPDEQLRLPRQKLAEMAEQAMGFPVTPANIAAAFAGTERKPPEPVRSNQHSALAARIEYLEKVVADLMVRVQQGDKGVTAPR